MAIPCFSRGKLSTRITCELGCIPPPPAPCSTLQITSVLSEGASPQRRELRVKITTQAMKNLLRPKTPESHPESGKTIALDTKYDVSTHVLSSTLAERLPAMCGSDTLATLVSKTSMNVASITVAAISHGFTSAIGLAYSAVVAISYWVRASAKGKPAESGASVASSWTHKRCKFCHWRGGIGLQTLRIS